jgi:uncharacterized protein YdaU (DUF1376 family)
MNQPKVFLFDVGVFLIETQGWSVAEVGTYVRLLISQWSNGSLPSDTQKLSRLCGLDHGNFKKLWGPTVKGMFNADGDGLLRNLRLEQIRQRQCKYLESQSKKGEAGAKKRWGQMALVISK